MDARRFDALARTFTSAASRRHALTGLVSALGLFGAWADETAAKNCKKIKNKKKRKKCLAKAAPCVASCAGKTCGDDGCGGSCGTCTGGACSQTGVCDCGSGKELCGGACVSACTASQIRPPGTCNNCCYVNGTFREVGLSTCVISCCSGKCTPSGPGHTCTGQALCDPCTFDAQCIEGTVCRGGRCVGASGSTLCP